MENKKENIGVMVSFILVIVVIIGVVILLLNRKEKIDPLEGIGAGIAEVQSETASQEEKGSTSTTENQMEKISKSGDVLRMNYTGRLTDGTVFDSNVDPKFNHVEPFKFILGAGQVITGWDEGLVGMKVGEKRTLTIPPEKGYGDRAVSSIPANSTLIFDVELLGIE